MLDFYTLNSCKITQIIYTSFYSKIGIIFNGRLIIVDKFIKDK